jgi:hypothetical protein
MTVTAWARHFAKLYAACPRGDRAKDRCHHLFEVQVIPQSRLTSRGQGCPSINAIIEPSTVADEGDWFLSLAGSEKNYRALMQTPKKGREARSEKADVY